MEVYFDSAATGKVLPEAVETMVKAMTEVYGNPSSASILGIEAGNVLKKSQEDIARIINAEPSEIYFTSGGTEGDNWAIFGTAYGYKRSGKHIITTNTEHPAINLPLEALKEEGFEIEKIGVDEKGYIDIEELKSKIRKDTILVSVILANNETGIVQDIEKIGQAVKEVNNDTLLHADAVQAFGKMKIDVKNSKIDMLSASGHKFGAQRGMGIFYMKKGLKVKPLMYGGGQQLNQRPGTENVAGAAAIAKAAEVCYKNLEENNEKIREIKKYIADRVLTEIPNTFINGDSIEKASPYVLNIGFMGLRSEVLLHALEAEGIYVSAGSACNSKKKVRSSVLSAMGKSDEEIEGSIRLSFSKFNTMEEAEYAVEKLKEQAALLRRFNRKR